MPEFCWSVNGTHVSVLVPSGFGAPSVRCISFRTLTMHLPRAQERPCRGRRRWEFAHITQTLPNWWFTPNSMWARFRCLRAAFNIPTGINGSHQTIGRRLGGVGGRVQLINRAAQGVDQAARGIT